MKGWVGRREDGGGRATWLTGGVHLLTQKVMWEEPMGGFPKRRRVNSRERRHSKAQTPPGVPAPLADGVSLRCPGLARDENLSAFMKVLLVLQLWSSATK